MSRNKLLRWTAYSIELLVLYIVQLTPGLIPAVFGARPLLLIPAAIAIAMFEGDTGGMIAGIVAGLLIDSGGSGVIGFHALLLGVACYFIGYLTMELIKTNLLTSLLFALILIPVICILQWVFYYLVWGYAGGAYVFRTHYLPKMLFTFAVMPLVYLFNRAFALRLREAA